MKAKLWGSDGVVYEVEVIGWTPPSRERKRIDRLGGPPIFVSGKTIPGNINFRVPIGFDMDKSYLIELDDRQMRVEITNLSTSARGSVAKGFIY